MAFDWRISSLQDPKLYIAFLLFLAANPSLAQVNWNLGTQELRTRTKLSKTKDQGGSSTQIEATLQMGAQYISSEWADQNAQSYFLAQAHYSYQSPLGLGFDLKPFLVSRTGYVQADFYNPGDQRAQMFIEQASAEWKPSGSVSFKIGVLPLYQWLSPLVAGRLGHTGVGFTTSWEQIPFQKESLLSTKSTHHSFRHQFDGYTFVPQSFQQNYTFDERRSLPLIQLLRAATQGQTESWRWSLHLAYVQFQNTPESLAEQSNLLGNSVIFATQSARVGFLYGYQLWEGSAQIGYAWTPRWETGLRLTQVYNPSAPQELNQAYLLEPSVTYYQGQWRYQTSYQYFLVQPDATIASLNSGFFETNRVGQRLILSAAVDEHQLSLILSERQPIYAHPFQVGEVSGIVQWEVKHDIL